MMLTFITSLPCSIADFFGDAQPWVFGFLGSMASIVISGLLFYWSAKCAESASYGKTGYSAIIIPIAGFLILSFGIAFATSTCSNERTFLRKDKIEVCGINMNMSTQEAIDAFLNYSNTNYPNARIFTGSYSIEETFTVKGKTIYTLNMADSISGTSLSIGFLAAEVVNAVPFLTSLQYHSPTGIPPGTYKTKKKDACDLTGRSAGLEFKFDDTSINLNAY